MAGEREGEAGRGLSVPGLLLSSSEVLTFIIVRSGSRSLALLLNF